MKPTNKLLLIATLVFLGACTTQKKKGDLSMMGKLYHNTTAKYNGYFNANELLMASQTQLEQQHQDNYTKLLDVYKYMATDNPQAVAGDLDNAIEKVTIVVSLHRQSHWTDDCYLLVSKAQFLKQDYEGAEETLRFLLDEYSPDKLAAGTSGGPSASAEKRKKEAKKEAEQKKKDAEEKRKEYNKKAKRSKKKKKRSSSKSKKKKKSAKQRKKEKEEEEARKKAEEEAKKAEETKIAEANAETAETAETDPDRPQRIRITDTKDPLADTPDSYFMKHRPAYQEGLLWMARTLIERENYEGAMRYIAQLEQSPKTFDDVRSQLGAVKAHLYMKREQYEEAIPALEMAMDKASRKEKARYAYIAAQIHQERGRGDLAIAKFDEAKKYSIDYEMDFNCELNKNLNGWVMGTSGPDATKSDLEKMLKDIKNEDYKDQIYYAMATIDLKTGNREEGIKNLRQSLKYSTQNKAQKAEAYLTLAELYYESENYVNAKYYYDSTLQVIAQTDERYDKVRRFSTSLKEIAENIETIELQDSLLQMASLSEEEKKALAFDIKKQQDEERRKSIVEKNKQRKNRAGPSRKAGQKESTFFVYNDRALKRGVRDFERKFGNRKLEDDWRRSNRRGAGEAEEEEEVIVDDVVPDFTDEEVKKLLGDLPSTPEEQANSELEIKKAMFALGRLYRERLENNKLTVRTLEELNARFPGNIHELDSWYYLYLAHIDLGNSTEASDYRKKIIDKYGDSTYAKILQNPNYLAEIKSEEKKLNDYYDQVFELFNQGKYQEAFNKSFGAKEKFGASNSLQPKFALLSAMCIGNLKGKEEYIKELQAFVAKYPNTPEQTRAREMLRLLGVVSDRLPKNTADNKGEQGDSPFKVEPAKLHYIIVVFNEDINNLNDMKIKLSDYNRTYHKLDKLRISNIYLGTQEARVPVLVVRRFKNQGEGMKYIDGIDKNKADFIEGDNYDIFAVTQNNYRQILKMRSVAEYKDFFNANYNK